MSNRRMRTRRRKKILGMSDTLFYMIIFSLTFLVIVFGIIYTVQKVSENKRISEEKERQTQELDELYQAANNEVASVDDYKSDTIVRISAVGDILCGKNMQAQIGNFDSVFEDIKVHLKDSNFGLGTYETDVKSEKQEFAKAVKNSGIDTLSLANSKTIENGLEGLNEINEYLKSVEAETVGIYKDTSQDRVKIVEKRNVKFAILAYTVDGQKEGINIYNEDIVKTDLVYAKENASVAIVLMHWGNENTNTVTKEQEEQANFLIENGADIIIGSHPSAIQKMEMKENKEGKQCLIAYSLGNYTSEGNNENGNLGLILNLQIYITKEGDASIYKVNYTPIYMANLSSGLKILDLKSAISKYEAGESELDKTTYDKLIRGMNKLNSVIEK